MGLSSGGVIEPIGADGVELNIADGYLRTYIFRVRLALLNFTS
jgi:hypothetical protein